mmetsp:Transcript_4741/g.9231  ORF Transcript_4741/g.9231 Transcript_4741/m.9231 type:complete len:216 (+) Transcript_4741:1008-1655(+)|eukprot:395657-Pleurochrysis_carterae.AAC.13
MSRRASLSSVARLSARRRRTRRCAPRWRRCIARLARRTTQRRQPSTRGRAGRRRRSHARAQRARPRAAPRRGRPASALERHLHRHAVPSCSMAHAAAQWIDAWPFALRWSFQLAAAPAPARVLRPQTPRLGCPQRAAPLSGRRRRTRQCGSRWPRCTWRRGRRTTRRRQPSTRGCAGRRGPAGRNASARVACAGVQRALPRLAVPGCLSSADRPR